MGDMADDLLDKLFDPESGQHGLLYDGYDDVMWDEEGMGGWYGPHSGASRNKTCRYCKKSGLRWVETEEGWRLGDKNGIHYCEQYRLRKHG